MIYSNEDMPYDWLLKFTRQTDWIDRRGKLIWLAEVSNGFGAGLYLISLYFNNLLGMFIGWLIIVIFKGGFHLSYLGKPLRFWRMALNPHTSWMARGFIFVLLFIGFGAADLAFSYWFPKTAEGIVFKVLAGVAVFMVVIYPAFVMNSVNAIPFWNSSMLPVLFILSGILDGCALILSIGLFGGNVDITSAEAIGRIFLITTAIFLSLYLLNATFLSEAGSRSVKELLKGSVAPVLWFGVILCGIIIPIVIAAYSYFISEASAGLLIIAICSETTGAFSLKYCFLKAGIYKPLILTIAR